MMTFSEQVSAAAGEPISLCYHCHKCTAGCPVSYSMTDGPDRLLRLVQLGQRERVLASPDIWLCAGCETCGTRCPNGIDLAHVMDALRQMARGGRVPRSARRVELFHAVFLRLVLLTGQMHEATLLAAYKLLSADLFSDLGAGARLIVKGKVPLLPRFSRNRVQVRRLFRQTPRRISAVREER